MPESADERMNRFKRKRHRENALSELIKGSSGCNRQASGNWGRQMAELTRRGVFRLLIRGKRLEQAWNRPT